MNSKSRNPPAFPTGHQGGMTLRDWFAGQVLPDCVSDYFRGVNDGEYPVSPEWPSGVAGDAYRLADAMMAARDKRE